MPGGFSGGAQGFGRFYRSAALTITNTETTISLDADSTLTPLVQVERDSGMIKSLIAGVCVCTLYMHMASSLSAQEITLRAYHILPDDSEILVSKSRYNVPALADSDTLMCIAALALDVDSRVRFTAETSTGSRDVEVGGETDTWAYIVIG